MKKKRKVDKIEYPGRKKIRKRQKWVLRRGKDTEREKRINKLDRKGRKGENDG